MNDTFDLKRFSLLLKKTILERPTQLLGAIGLILIATLVIYAAALKFMGWPQAQNLAFIWGFVGGGCFLSSIIFGYFNTNASGSAYLTLPASSFEKWLCGVIITGVFFIGLFLIYYRVMDACFVIAYHNSLDKNNPAYKLLYDAATVYPFTSDGNVFRQSVSLYSNFSGAMLLGSLYFNRVSAIKTALLYCGMLGVIYFLNLIIANAFFTDVDQANPFYNLFIKVGTGVGIVELPPAASGMADISWRFIIPAVLWTTAFIRLREKEI